MSSRAIRIVFRGVAVVALALACLGPVDRARGQGEQRPNLIVILADDMGYGDASCYGNEAYQTPNIDALAEAGMRFTDFHSSGPVCSPTRAGLLTGRYQQRAGISGVIYADPKQNRHHGLQLKEITFAERLRKAGYVTGIFGKWHLGYSSDYNPTLQGFDDFRGYVSGNIDYINHLDRMGIPDWWHKRGKAEEDGYSTHRITHHAVQFIERNRHKPFCLYVAHEAPHAPYQGPNDKPIRVPYHVVKETYEPGTIPRAYREMMQEMDKGVGEIVAAIKSLGLAKQTLIVFFSDNGGTRHGSNGALRGFKGSVWEGGHRVPAIVSWPGHIEPGSTCDALAISLDIMPTLLDLAGADVPEDHHLDGVSLRPLLEGQTMPERTLFWDYNGHQAVRQGNWKLVVNEEEKPLLFQLDEDLGEESNLADREPDRVEALRKALEDWKADVADGATEQPDRKGEAQPE